MCYAVRIVVAAPGRERRLALRRAAVSAEWEVVGEADGPDTAVDRVVGLRARFLVVDADAAGPRPQELVARLAGVEPRVFVVGVGEVSGVDATVGADDLTQLRDVLAGLLHGSCDHVH